MAKPKEKSEQVDSSKIVSLQPFNFPEHDLTVFAVDMQDALSQLDNVLKSNPK